MAGPRAAMLAGLLAGGGATWLAYVETGTAPHAIAAGTAAATVPLAPRFPRATRIVVLAALLAAVPSGVGTTAALAAAGHAFWVARREEFVAGAAFAFVLVAIVLTGLMQVPGNDAFVPTAVVIAMAWAAGRALRGHDLAAHELAERARELVEERDAHAALSARFERARIASELHDIVGHALSVMVVQAAAGQRLAAANDERAAAVFNHISDAARQAEGDLGRLVALLVEDDGAEASAELALVTELIQRASASGLQVRLRLEGDRDAINAQVAAAAYRVVQEALTNAMRHAPGAPVEVLVRGEPERLVVEIANGAVPAGAQPLVAGGGEGHGLTGVRDCVGALGGALAAGVEGSGWRVAASLPRQLTRTSDR